MDPSMQALLGPLFEPVAIVLGAVLIACITIILYTLATYRGPRW